MDITVIIPLFNGAPWIRQTLESVFAQSQPPLEIIVIDDGSTDKSPEIAQSFPRVRLLYNPNKGSQFARHFGWQQTTAPLIAFLDQDDIWHPDHLKILSSLLEQHPKCPAAIASCCWFESDKSLTFSLPTAEPELFDPWQSFPINLVDTPSASLIRREALEQVGGWTTQFSLGTDAYMWFRLSIERPLIKNREVTVGYRLRNDSNSTRLRLNRVQHYFETVVAASEAVLLHQLAVKPQGEEHLKKRLGMLTPMTGILKAIANADRLGLQASALALEASLVDESEVFLKAACQMLFWFLLPSLCLASLEQRYQVLNLLLSWPPEANQTRQVMLQRAKGIVSIWIFLKYLQRNPWQLQRWSLVTDVVRRRVRR